MKLRWAAGDNYVDLRSPCPFTITDCNSVYPRIRNSSGQIFPLHGRRKDPSSDDYLVTLWGLNVDVIYGVCGFFTDQIAAAHDDTSLNTNSSTVVDGMDSGEISTSPNSQVFYLNVKTNENNGPLRLCGAAAILDVQVLYRDDFLDCLLSQLGEWMIIEQFESRPETLLQRLFYHSLFAVPGKLYEVNIYSLPNGVEGRFCLDLTQEGIPWRRNKKVRRVISSQSFVVAVNRDIKHSLSIAREYHIERKGSTWLKEDYIDLLVSVANNPEYGVRLMSVELLEKSTGKVVAGCLGYALGVVYHDFTMFTVQHSPEGLGTFITKLLGEALQMCGYNMWYWGFRLDYMQQFEKRYGGRIIYKSEFLTRWAQHRDMQPDSELEDFFRAGRGMVPLVSLG